MEEDLQKALDVLQKGGLILYPTDTIWGIGCDPGNALSIDRIYRLKKRPDSTSMLILIDLPARLQYYAMHVPEVAYELMEIADKPLTIIYQGAHNLAPNLPAPDGSIGIRVCSDPFCQALIQRFRKPLVSTSANPHGKAFPRNFAEINSEILLGVDYVVKWRREDPGPGTPSTLIKLGPGGEIQILRK